MARGVQSRTHARSIAPAAQCSARTRLPHARVASSPGLPDLNGHIHVHMVFGAGAWSEVITFLTVMMFRFGGLHVHLVPARMEPVQ